MLPNIIYCLLCTEICSQWDSDFLLLFSGVYIYVQHVDRLKKCLPMIINIIKQGAIQNINTMALKITPVHFY